MRERYMKLCFYTQDHENYGSEEKAYWKPKGGEDFIIEAPVWTEEMTTKVCDLLAVNNPFFQRSVIGFDEVSDDYMTQFERSQLEYDGEIEFPAIRFTFDELIKLSEKESCHA